MNNDITNPIRTYGGVQFNKETSRYEATTPASTVRFSSAIMNGILSREYDLTNMDEETKREFFISLKLAINAAEAIGWFEHTNDWDIFYGFKLKSGSSLGTYKQNEENALTIIEFEIDILNDAKLNLPALPPEQPATHITFEYDDDEEGEQTFQIHINQITHFTVERAG